VKFKKGLEATRLKFLQNDWHSSQDLLNLIVIKCESDLFYYKKFLHWVRSGGSIYLRDSLCLIFEDKINKSYGGDEACIFYNAWTGLDTARGLIKKDQL
jgi:hypothetical protein